MHRHEAVESYTARVITVSTSRFEKYGRIEGVENIPEDDGSGRLIAEVLGERVKSYVLVPDDAAEIRKAVVESEEDVVIITGGTGLNPGDITVEAIEPLFEKRLDGFGEIFRIESYKEIGYSAILSRATAGIIDGKAVFCLPGSKNAVRLGMEIVVSIAKHVISHARGIR
ncbi:MogA/MoaB family molybdenum cofactor biosynthesis protein [Geoglobus acetivorans]|uniref:Molybdenum cofactor biosynthesis protein MoaB n=1 Tax=Geoglobus acetivorans TaxID=565033 RepID=A0A0A7GHH7_GEOAI|nr:Molybdenum cofactor biosynthesis protein MoaB [Geoglobus acetivorans]